MKYFFFQVSPILSLWQSTNHKLIKITTAIVTSLLLSVSAATFAQLPKPLDYYKSYQIIPQLVDTPIQIQILERFGFEIATVKHHTRLLTPVDLDQEGISDQHGYFNWYDIQTASTNSYVPALYNRYGLHLLSVGSPVALLTSAKIGGQGTQFPTETNDYIVYPIIGGTSVDSPVTLQDQFEYEENRATVPMFVAGPVNVSYNGVISQIHPNIFKARFLIFYKITPHTAEFERTTDDKFTQRVINTLSTEFFVVPSDGVF